jgi:cyclase
LPAAAQPDDLAEALRTTPIKPQKIADDFYVLFGVGGNILVSIGAEGTLIVDAQFVPMVPKYEAAIRQLGGGKINFVINTHWHFDHTDGDQTLGREGAWIVAQENTRQMMMKDNVINLVTQKREQPAYAESAWPVITFDHNMRMHFNGETIDLLHYGPAHTAGDAVVVFRRHNVVHMGDVYNNAGYPFIDVDNGGSLSGTIEFASKMLAQIDANTIVVPGDGPVAGYQDLADYVTMLTTIRDRIAALVASGATLKQVIAAEPTSEWDDKKGDPSSFIDRAYASLSKPSLSKH